MLPQIKTNLGAIQETGQIHTTNSHITTIRDKTAITKHLEVDLTQGQTTGMLTQSTQVGATPQVEITPEIGTTLETGIILQVDTNPEIDITPAIGITPETEIILQVDTNPGIDITPKTANIATIKGHLVDKDLNHPTTEGRDRPNSSNRPRFPTPGPAPRECYECKSPDHLIRNCPKLSKAMQAHFNEPHFQQGQN